LLGIRLDSGDLAALSKEARKLLDAAGFETSDILASNSLDEYVISDLKRQGARISSWGVGTNLATAYDHPALDGVYKLSALRDTKGEWQYKLKISEQEVKVSNPGRHQVRRYFCNDQFTTDVIYDLTLGIPDVPESVLFDPSLPPVRLDDYDAFIDLLQPIFRKGKLVQAQESIHNTRDHAIHAVNEFYRTHDEKTYPVGLEKYLYALKKKLVEDLSS
jgi:nicotinate phosphoribosyltransferase